MAFKMKGPSLRKMKVSPMKSEADLEEFAKRKKETVAKPIDSKLEFRKSKDEPLYTPKKIDEGYDFTNTAGNRRGNDY